MSDELIKELDWCIQNGNVGPRSLKALCAARAHLAALESAEKEAVPVAWVEPCELYDEIFEGSGVTTATLYKERGEYLTVPLYTHPAPTSKDAIRREALEEAAQLIEPRNAPDDWTEYAKIRAEAAAAIRALSQKVGDQQ